MKVTIVKYLNSNGKVVEMRKDNFKGSFIPKNIIEEYEVEIKGEGLVETSWLEELKRKYSTGNYIKIWKCNSKLENPTEEDKCWGICNTILYHEEFDYKLIHYKHKDILEAYLKNPSVKIECTNNISKDVDIETIWYSEGNFIENYDENMYYRLKVKIPVWYEDENMIGKLVFNSEFNNFDIFEGRNNRTIKCLFSEYDLEYAKDYLRPATESEVLSLVYKPQQKVSKETSSTESNRLKYLFLSDRAECLVENEQEFKLVYDFLDKTCDKKLNRFLESDGSFHHEDQRRNLPIVISTAREWGNIYEWDRLEDRNLNKPLIKPLIKFDGETFSEVFE